MNKPFSSKKRSLHLGNLGDGFHYAFDFDNPSGIKLIQKKTRNRLERLNSGTEIFDVANPTDAALRNADLLIHEKLPPADIKNTKRSLSIWLHVINGCNFSCSYCYIPHLRKVVDPKTLSKYSLSAIDARLIADGVLKYCRDNELHELHIKFAGGEPTLDMPTIDNFCKYIRANGNGLKVSFGMITNGSFEFDDIEAVLVENISSLSISIDGFEGTHDDIRFSIENKNRKGSWDKIWENVEKLIAVGLPPYFLFTITNKNYYDIPKFSKMVLQRGLGYRFSLVRNKKPYDFDTVKAITEALISHYIYLGENLDPKLPISRHAKFSEWNLKKKKYLACSSCRQYIAVDQNANVASCQMNFDNPSGNLSNQSLDVIYENFGTNPKTSQLRSPMERKGTCSRCEYYHVCSGGCPQHTLQSKGNMDEASSWCYTFGEILPHYVDAIALQMKRKAISLRER